MSAVKASVKLGNLVAGRWTLGQVCHTLQVRVGAVYDHGRKPQVCEIMFLILYMKDFYSHSNWVEMGNNAPYSALIRPDQPLEKLAGRILLPPVSMRLLLLY